MTKELQDQDRVAAEKEYRIFISNRAFEFAMDSLTAGYPPSEISSWERQRAEHWAQALEENGLTQDVQDETP